MADSLPVETVACGTGRSEHAGLIFGVSVGDVRGEPGRDGRADHPHARRPLPPQARAAVEAVASCAAHRCSIVVRNVVGAALLLAGVVMLADAGSGVLCILVGISLLDIPGKRQLETAIVQREPVHKSIDWIRRKAGRPPLKLPPRAHGALNLKLIRAV